MNAPLIEELLRVFVALTATWASGMLLFACARRLYPPNSAPLLWFLTGAVAINAVWSWILVFLGLMTDIGEWSWTLTWVQPTNAALLFVLYFALGLLTLHHLKGVRRG